MGPTQGNVKHPLRSTRAVANAHSVVWQQWRLCCRDRRRLALMGRQSVQRGDGKEDEVLAGALALAAASAPAGRISCEHQQPAYGTSGRSLAPRPAGYGVAAAGTQTQAYLTGYANAAR